MEDTSKEKVKTVFGKNADKYLKSESHAKGDDLPLLIDWLEPEKAWIVLDIATGGGHVTKILAPHVGTVFSTDITKEMLENTAKHLNTICDNIIYIIADAESLPFLRNTFDVVVCRIAPHHFPSPEKFIQEASRVLKANGKFILIDNVAPSDSELDEFMNTTEKLRDDSHVRCLSKYEWIDLFQVNHLVEKKSLDRKKTFLFPEWVARTTENEEQVNRVKNHLLQADKKAAHYFAIAVQGKEIQSFMIDEWMVMCVKKNDAD